MADERHYPPSHTLYRVRVKVTVYVRALCEDFAKDAAQNTVLKGRAVNSVVADAKAMNASVVKERE